MDKLFEQFVRERGYLKAVTPKTIIFYRQAWASLRKGCAGEEITKADLIDFIIRLKDKGIKPVSINTYSRALNAFFNWCFIEGHLPVRLTLQKLKEEQIAVKPMDDSVLKTLISFKPLTFGENRLQALLMVLIDCGLRVNEAITLKRVNVDFDNFLITVAGKGGKERVVPFSTELRKVLYRFLNKHTYDFVFPTRYGGEITYRNLLRDYGVLCKRLKIEQEGSFHRFRHNFALQYVRAGGSLFHLQKQLGHQSLIMTRRYTELETKDLQEAHARVSPLNRLKR